MSATISRKKRPPLWIFPALLFALLINGLLFLLLPLLTHIRAPRDDMTVPVAVHLIRVREKTPPPKEEEEEWRKPEKVEKEARLSFQPDLVKPLPHVPDMPAFPLEMKPSMIETPNLGLKMFYNARDLDHPPRALAKIPPLYPYKAKRLEIEGVVKVKFLVDETGAVSRISILNSSPEGVFEESVMKILPNWKFTPGRILGEPVPSWVVTTIRFELE